MEKINIYIIACSYSMHPVELVKKIERYFNLDRYFLQGYVASTRDHGNVFLKDGWEHAYVNNDDYDFSAYFSGARWAEDKRGNGIFIFINDTLFTNHSPRVNIRGVLGLAPIIGSVDIPVISGKCDKYWSICLSNPWGGVDRYVSTYCFAVNRLGIEKIKTLRKLAEDDGLCNNLPIEDESWGIGLSKTFRAFLRAHLYFEGSPYKWYRFHSGFYSAEQVAVKARCVYYEHRLSGEIARDGGLMPINDGGLNKFKIHVAEKITKILKCLNV